MHAIHAARHPPGSRRCRPGAGAIGGPQPERGGGGGDGRGARSRAVGPGATRPVRRRRHLEEGGCGRSRPCSPGPRGPRGVEVRIALDTNRYTDLCKGVDDTVELVSTAEEVVLPFVVVAELRAGFAFGKRSAENEG